MSAEKVGNPTTILTEKERARLIALIDLHNDLSVTQIDRHEGAELSALIYRLRG